MKEIPPAYEDSLLDALLGPEPIPDAREVLLKLAHDGYESDVVLRWLNELRSSFRERELEEQEDLIADVMDIASGWCNPKLRVWASDAS